VLFAPAHKTELRDAWLWPPHDLAVNLTESVRTA